MGKHPLLDVASAASQPTGDVGDNDCAHPVIVHFPEKVSRLLVIRVRMCMLITPNNSVMVSASPCVALVLHGAPERVRLVVDLRSLVTVSNNVVSDHVGDTGAVGTVNRDMVVVGTEAVTVSVGVGEETALEHLVEGGFDAGDEVTG